MYIRKILLMSFLCLSSVVYASSSSPGLQPLGADEHPDFPLNGYVAGQLGRVPSSFASSYLLVAYRYLNHNAFTKTQQQTALAAWEKYFNDVFSMEELDYAGPINAIDGQLNKHLAQQNHTAALAQWVKTIQARAADYFNWRSARLAALGLPTEVPMPGADDNDSQAAVDVFYQELANKEDNIGQIYPATGFNYLKLATERLLAVKKALEQANKSQLTQPVDAVLKTWISAQQQIFKKSAEGGEQARNLLAQLPTNLPPLVAADKDYSIAASSFYSQDSQLVEMSAGLFSKLAHQSDYPWHVWAEYLKNRALFVAANLSEQSANNCDARCQNLKQQALQGMQNLAKSADNPEVKAAAVDYERIIHMLNREPNTLSALIQRLDADFRTQDFYDFIVLPQDALDKNQAFIQWLNYVKNNDTDSFAAAYQHWQQKPKEFAWLWLAVNKLSAASASQQKELEQAVLAIPENDYAYIPVRAALIEQSNNLANPVSAPKQRELIDSVLKQITPGTQFSTSRFLLDQRAAYAASLDDLMQHAFFFPDNNASIMHPADVKGWSLNYMVPAAVEVINQLPMSVLLKLADMRALPDNYRPALYANLWVRAVLLNDTAMIAKTASKAAQFNPVLKDTIAKMAAATNNDARETAFLSALLTYPSLSPMFPLNLYQTWNAFDDGSMANNNAVVLKPEQFDSEYNNFLWQKCTPKTCKNSPADFLTNKEKSDYQAQYAKLINLDSGSTYIANRLVVLARKHPRDETYARLLALAIKATRYTNGDSKRAFIILKKLYPNTQASEETEYYFKSSPPLD
ncbi:MAG TPA: hypothetical protein VHE99_11865 [Gammaproteobacteria bacterium]|nr:hypothetical protein [Gammaproteobacteria bacterium]